MLLKLSVMSFGSNLFTSFVGLYVLILIEEKFNSVLFNGLFGDLSRIILIIVALFLGPIIEMQVKKKVMVGSFAIISLLLLPEFLLVHTHFFFISILILDVLMAFFIDVNAISKTTYIKLILTEDRMQQTLGSIGSFTTAGSLLGTIGAAFLYGKVNWLYILVAGLIIFLINFILMATLPPDRKVQLEKKTNLQHIRDGFNYIRMSRLLKGLVFIIVVYNACAAVVTSLIIFYWGSIDQGFNDTVLIFAGIGLGIGAGMGWVNLFKNYRHPMVFLLIMSMTNGGAMIALGMVQSKVLFASLAGLVFFTFIIISPVVGAMRIKATADLYTSRVTSIINLFSAIGSVIIILIFASLSDLLHADFLPYLAAGILTITSISFFWYIMRTKQIGSQTSL